MLMALALVFCTNFLSTEKYLSTHIFVPPACRALGMRWPAWVSYCAGDHQCRRERILGVIG